MPRFLLLRLMLALPPLAAAGCDATDPFQRPEMWNPTGANDANLTTMVADPMDLVHGRGETAADGQLAAAAVARLRHDRVKQLPDMDTTGGTVGGSASGAAGGGGSAGAGSGN